MALDYFESADFDRVLLGDARRIAPHDMVTHKCPSDVSIRKDERKELTKTLESLRGENPFEVRVPGGPSRWAAPRPH